MTVKHESVESYSSTPSVVSTEPLRDTDLCGYASRVCRNPRAPKRSGALGRFCDLHRSQATNAQRKKQQRERLLKYLINALQQDDPITPGMPENDPNVRSRQRPRLVLLGNQQTLILGVVLSDRGAAAAADLVGLRP